MAEQETPTTETQETSWSEKAAGLFGDQYKGEVTKLPDTQEEVVEETEETEEITEDEQAEATPSDAEDSGTVEGAGEYELSHVAELLGVEEDRLDVNEEGRVVLVSKVDGQTQPVSAKDLLDNAQMFAAADKRLEDAKKRSETQTQEFQRQQQALEQQFVKAGGIIDRAKKLLDKDSQSIDWKQLREDDPAEYAAKKAEIEERRKEIDSMEQEAVEQYQQSAQQSQMTPEQYQQALQEENQKLLSAVPEWKDDKKANEGKRAVVNYMVNQGFNQNDIQVAAHDHRLLAAMHKARLYDEGMAKTDAAKKKVAKVPKVMKPGAAKSKQDVDSEKVKRAEQRFQESPTPENALALRQAKAGG